MKKSIIALTIVLSAVILSAVSVDGWDKTRWGMSVDEVKSLYSDSGIRESDRNDQILVIESIRLNDKNYSVTFSFKTGMLTGVSIVMKEAMACDYNDAVYSLSRKYGKTANSDKMTTVWLFPKTVITCKYSDYAGKGMLIITYSLQSEFFK